jgi:hypothetical protein
MNKFKWTVITSTKYNDFVVFTRFLDKLLKSCDLKRTEFLFVGPNDAIVESLFKDTTYSFIPEIEDNPYQNAALNYAQADDIVILSNRTVVPKNFLVRLSYCLFASSDISSNIGIVVPITQQGRCSEPQSNIKTTTPERVDEIQETLDTRFVKVKPWVLTGAISDFCIMVRKSVVEKVGVFNNIEGDSSRATDWCIRAYDAGIHTLVAGNVYVFWDSNKFEDCVNLIPKVYKQEHQSLAVCYRIHIDDKQAYEIFLESLKKSCIIADYIFVIDANSKFKVKISLEEQEPELWARINNYQKFSRPYDEKRDFNDLLDLVDGTDATWVLMLDDNDVLENKVDKQLMLKLMNPLSPQVRAYTLNQYYMWNSSTKWRLDATWGQVHDVRFFKYVKQYRINRPGATAPHCGYAPSLPVECIRDTNIRIRSYGFMTPEWRQRKKEIFEKAEREEGKDTYNYFTSDLNVSFMDWVEQRELSVYAPANRGGSRLEEWLDHVWYFADEVVIGSDDLDFISRKQLESCSVKVVPIAMKDDFSAGRNSILKHCTKDYIFQLDIDERIQGYSWHRIRRMMDAPEPKAWMFSIDNHQKDGSNIVTDTIRLFKNENGVFYWGLLHETIDDYVRKKGWKVGHSPVRLKHFGFLWTPRDDAFKKMQHYLELNFEQMKRYPNDGRAYYNLAMHFFEDGLLNDGHRLLTAACSFPPTFALPIIELGKSFVAKALQTFNVSKKYVRAGDDHIVKGLEDMCKHLDQVKPIYVRTAPNHVIGYFERQPHKLQEIREHLDKIEEFIESQK